MADLNRIINRFIADEISLSISDITRSAASRQWLTEGIANKISLRVNQPRLYSEKPFVNFGSYFKGTKAGFIDEYDILVVLDTNNGIYHNNGIITGHGLGRVDPNPIFSGNYDIEGNSVVSPTKLLNWLKGVIEEFIKPFGMESPVKDGQAITVYSKNSNTYFDFVPACILKNVASEETFFVIPRGNNKIGWIMTNPQNDIKLMNDLSQDRTNFKNVIRLVKFIKDKYNFKVPSFSVECNSVSYVQLNYWHNNIAQDFLNVLGHLQRNFKTGKILDTFDYEANVIEGVESLDWYSDRVANIIERISNLQNMFISENDAYQKFSSIMYNR